MKASARGTARLLSGVGCVAALLLPAAVPAQALPLSQVPTADGKKGQELPGMPSALDADAACTPASREKAKKQDWSRQRLDLDRLHGYSVGAGVTVALIDTGVETGAAGLDGRVSAQGAAGDDCVGHGTFLAGLIAGTGGNGARLTGAAPGAKILALRGTDQRGQANADLVVAALREATEAGAEVIAVAVALPRRDAELTRAVAEARRKGAVVVAAATLTRPGPAPTRFRRGSTGRPVNPACCRSPTCFPAGSARTTRCGPPPSTWWHPAPGWSPAGRAATATTSGPVPRWPPPTPPGRPPRCAPPGPTTRATRSPAG